MNNQYKMPMPIYIGHKLKNVVRYHFYHALRKAAGSWYCNSCHKYHLGNVIRYNLHYNDWFEEIVFCHKGLKGLRMDFPPPSIISQGDLDRVVLLTAQQMQEVKGKGGDK